MSWQKLILQVPKHMAESASEYLEETGALSITLEPAENEELFEPAPGTTPLWQLTQLSALFAENTPLQDILVGLKQAIAPEAIVHYSMETLADQDWQKACTDAFSPQCFGERLWICPSWHEPPEPDTPCVILDPGLAFGTGAHPTTALCLEWLAQFMQAGDSVIDYGCGSGILAIAALKLGAKEVWAVDNDPQALEATLENAKRNHCSPAALHVMTPPQLPPLQVDILLANILANPLIHLAPELLSLLKPQGKIVLSGILPQQADAVMAAYQSGGIAFSEPTIQDDWLRLEGTLSRF